MKNKKLKELLQEDLLNEMANYRQKATGLPMIVWILEKKDPKHGPRIKAQTNHSDRITDEFVSVTIEDSPRVIGKGLSNKDFNIIKKFIKLNKISILEYWNQNIDANEFYNKMIKM